MKHGEHLEASKIAGLNHRVQESTSPMGAPQHQKRSRSHVLGQMIDDPILLRLVHPHESRQINNIILFQVLGHVQDIAGVKDHALGQIIIRRKQAEGHGIGLWVDVIVVEGGGGEVIGGQDDGSERERTRADEGYGGRDASAVLGEDGELKEAELEVVGVVREDVEVAERVVEGAEDGGVVALEKAFGLATESNEFGSNLLKAFGELGDINRAGWYACEDELGKKGVDILAGFETIEAGDLVVEVADLSNQQIFLAHHVDTMRRLLCLF